MALLEQRVALLDVLRRALGEPGVVRPDRRRERRARRCARSRSSPPATACAQRKLGHGLGDRAGADGLRGARSRSCVPAARELSRFAQDVYDGSLGDAARSVRGAGRPARRRRRADQEGVPHARARAAPRRQHRRPAGRGEVQGGGGGLRDPVGPRSAGDLRPLRPRGPALRRLPARTSTSSARSETCSRRSSAGRGRRHVRRRRRRAARARGRRRRRASSSSTWRRPRRAARSPSAYEAVDRCEHCHGNGAEPGTPIETCERCGGAGRRQARARARRSARSMRAVVCDACAATAGSPRSRARLPRPRPRWSTAPSPSRCRPGSRTASGCGSPVAATPASAARRAGDLYVLIARARGRALRARGRRPDHRARRAGAARRARREPRGADARRADRGGGARPAPSPAR